MKPITKILIANRSEVALRLQAAYRARGIATVAVFCPEDRHLSFVTAASEAYQLTLSGHAAYFNQDEIIAIALRAGVQAIAPGYGFLSESAVFAQKVIDAGLVWIGPAPSCMTLMSSKIGSRNTMTNAGVPVVPGFVVTDLTEQGKAAARIQAGLLGYPLMIKDPQSGGGKAMRRVQTEADFGAAWDAVLAEGRRLTTSTMLLVERYLEQGRHVEVQVAGDGQSFIHLFERECSIQRRHQKIIEEAPCLFVNTSTLERMYQAALTAACAVGYNSIGTVEFMVTPDGDFYFLEMNTRLQVEHGVTEMTTGIDLVLLQLDIAKTGMLPLQQAAVTRRGHAVECRLYAEDPAQRFTPSTGTISHLTLPAGPFLRVEHDLRQGQEVTPFFDPMIAKLLAFGVDRQASLNNMVAALEMTRLEGIKTNRLFLLALLRDRALVSGAFHTQSLADTAFMERLLDVAQPAHEVDAKLAMLAGLAVALAEQEQQSGTRHAGANQSNLTTGASRRRWKDQLSWR